MNRPKHRMAPLLVAGLVWAHGCMSLPAPVTRSNPDKLGAVQFDGLEKLLNQNHQLRLLIVHGMSPHSVGYSKPFQLHLAEQLHLSPDPADTCAVVDTWSPPSGSASYVQRCSYRRDSTVLRVYELTWAGLSHFLSDKYLASDWLEHGSDRVAIDAAVKKGLIDQAFSDAIIYSGTFAETMRTATRRAVCVLMTDPPDTGKPASTCTFALRIQQNTPAPPIIVISHSLGSMMVFETISGMLADTTESADKVSARDFVRRLKLVALLANQLPLLALARNPESSSAAQPIRGLALFENSQTNVPIVAVSDPNDLLTYPLASGWPRRLGSDGARVINVTMPNATNVVGAVVNPGTAHTGYFDNPCVARLLVSGEPQCWWSSIYGAHYENPGRMQIDAGWLLHSNTAISFPVYASIGPGAVGITPIAFAVRRGTLVAQLRPSYTRATWKPVRAGNGDNLFGLGLRLSAFSLTGGIDAVKNTTTHKTYGQMSWGTGW